MEPAPWTPAHWRARALRRRLRNAWGPDGDRQRANEAVWLKKRLGQLGVTHVHAHFAGMAARTAYWLRQISDITFSITAHANDFLVASKQRRLPELFSDARFIITETDFSVDYIRTHFPQTEGKVHRVYNGIECDQFVSRMDPLIPPRILCVGRYVEKKGYFDLINACAKLKELDFTCDLVGTGPLEQEMRNRIDSLGLAGRIRVTGPRSGEEIRRMLGEASLFVLACRFESDGGSDNLPTVILEAMSASRPVVSTRVAGVPEMIEDGKSGFLVPEQNPEQLAEAIRKLLAEPVLSREMGREGSLCARRTFDVSVTTPQLAGLFRSYGVVS